jgi:hypothetical protein
MDTRRVSSSHGLEPQSRSTKSFFHFGRKSKATDSPPTRQRDNTSNPTNKSDAFDQYPNHSGDIGLHKSYATQLAPNSQHFKGDSFAGDDGGRVPVTRRVRVTSEEKGYFVQQHTDHGRSHDGHEEEVPDTGVKVRSRRKGSMKNSPDRLKIKYPNPKTGLPSPSINTGSSESAETSEQVIRSGRRFSWQQPTLSTVEPSPPSSPYKDKALQLKLLPVPRLPYPVEKLTPSRVEQMIERGEQDLHESNSMAMERGRRPQTDLGHNATNAQWFTQSLIPTRSRERRPGSIPEVYARLDGPPELTPRTLSRKPVPVSMLPSIRLGLPHLPQPQKPQQSFLDNPANDQGTDLKTNSIQFPSIQTTSQAQIPKASEISRPLCLQKNLSIDQLDRCLSRVPLPSLISQLPKLHILSPSVAGMPRIPTQNPPQACAKNQTYLNHKGTHSQPDNNVLSPGSPISTPTTTITGSSRRMGNPYQFPQTLRSGTRHERCFKAGLPNRQNKLPRVSQRIKSVVLNPLLAQPSKVENVEEGPEGITTTSPIVSSTKTSSCGRHFPSSIILEGEPSHQRLHGVRDRSNLIRTYMSMLPRRKHNRSVSSVVARVGQRKMTSKSGAGKLRQHQYLDPNLASSANNRHIQNEGSPLKVVTVIHARGEGTNSGVIAVKSDSKAVVASRAVLPGVLLPMQRAVTGGNPAAGWILKARYDVCSKVKEKGGFVVPDSRGSVTQGMDFRPWIRLLETIPVSLRLMITHTHYTLTLNQRQRDRRGVTKAQAREAQVLTLIYLAALTFLAMIIVKLLAILQSVLELFGSIGKGLAGTIGWLF